MKKFSAIKNLFTLKKLFSLAVLGTVISGCTIEPVQFERDAGIKGAPDWVNKGSVLSHRDGERVFLGVSSANPQGDMALQKSIADDNSMAEVAVILSTYLDAVSNEYMNTAQSRENGLNDDKKSRQLSEAAVRQIKEGVSHQIDEAIARQFKEKASRQFKDDVTRQIYEVAMRPIREAISSQMEFSAQLETIIQQQIKEAVARQVKNTIKADMTAVRIVKNWRDPKTGTIWSVSELDLKHVKSTVAVASDMNVELKNYFEENADMVFDRATLEINSMNPFSFK